MPWPGIQFQFALLLLAATVGPPGVLAEGNVGCLFSERLCLDEEWCHDDYAFGRCLPATGDLDENDLYRFDLEKGTLHQIQRELQRLFALGYRWSHGYTQCRLQAMLYSTKNGVSMESDACSHLADQDLEGALKAVEGREPLDPREMAIIKYTPSVKDPHAQYADEVYYPPVDETGARESIREKILPPKAVDILDMDDPYANYVVKKRVWIPQMHRRSLPSAYDDYLNGRHNNNPKEILHNDDDDQDPDALEFLPHRQPYESREINYNDIEDEDQYDGTSSLTLEEMNEMYPLVKFLNKMQLTPQDLQKVLSPDSYEKLEKLLVDFEESAANHEDQIKEFLESESGTRDKELTPSERFPFLYTPDHSRSDWKSKNSRSDWESKKHYFKSHPNEFPEPRIYFDENEEEKEAEEEAGSGLRGQHSADEIFRELKQSRPLKNDGIFRGLGQTRETEQDKEGFRTFENDQRLKGKSESYDIHLGSHQIHPGMYTEGGVVYAAPSETHSTGEDKTTPGEPITLDMLLEKYNLGFKRPERLDVKKPGPPFSSQTNEGSILFNYLKNRSVILPSMMKKTPRGAPHPYPYTKEFYDLDESDADYVFVGFEKKFQTWREGSDVIRNISTVLHLEPNDFRDGRVHGNVIYFRVLPNSRGLNATEVVKKIELAKDELTQDTGLRVIGVGTKGDKAKLDSVLSARMGSDNEFYIVMFTVCGVLGAMIIAATLLILIRRHIRSREKLHGLARPDTEASKDYQDLCRARMATKAGQAQTSDGSHGRITSLSKESEQSPSSRSSTSSWSEEPALHNMDISTGHMVLSYMEDHLKNKDRLEQEWVALCAYVAEPCEISIATKKDNLEKNRYPDIVTYDHSRVVLNELSNLNGSDYINASTITDHDPRNPAYIGTQGPLPNTSADFWQLIWEQGAVVIVMLTRLTESGAAMCHRYWPEEGSELYHIYEVHLVSEHIWCDDYLVRSFYLKNIRTGETRTVTQFHFLSWPETGVPASTKALLEFRRKVNKSYRGRSCPIVVHCSDGAGRTGTYCLIDMVLSRMAKGAKEIDIAATLEHLRDQRPKMVATKQQFEFVLTAVAEEVHAILKALPAQPIQQEKEK